MKVYAASYPADLNSLFSLEPTAEKMVCYQLDDLHVLDLMNEDNFNFYLYEAPESLLFIGEWMQQNPERQYDPQFVELVLQRESKSLEGLYFKEGLKLFTAKNLIRKPSAEELSRLEIKLLSPAEARSLLNQDLSRFEYTQDFGWDTQRKDAQKMYYVVALVDAYLVGLMKISEVDSDDHTPALYTNFISVDPEWREKGIGRKLKEKMFELAAANEMEVNYGRYSELGQERLEKVNAELAKKYKVTFRQRNGL